MCEMWDQNAVLYCSVLWNRLVVVELICASCSVEMVWFSLVTSTVPWLLLIHSSCLHQNLAIIYVLSICALDAVMIPANEKSPRTKCGSFLISHSSNKSELSCLTCYIWRCVICLEHHANNATQVTLLRKILNSYRYFIETTQCHVKRTQCSWFGLFRQSTAWIFIRVMEGSYLYGVRLIQAVRAKMDRWTLNTTRYSAGSDLQHPWIPTIDSRLSLLLFY